MTAIAVLTNLPDSDSAFNLARELVSLRLAACANVLAPATSFYRWEGREEQATEVPVLIKSTRERYPALEAHIKSRHPYSVPEIIAWPLELGSAEYLAWVERESQPI
ncbi:divalent-cation tolerance protein CutA [Usitatibacter palustris]|uniref:Divalent-cation tolerance protein CutA n=1 Tax=Usitatibacter palustris TaxID=2732487 RepID=A0A6M4HCD4_9PROT|nr:divalent-cation tolerance protein CutA [Usitatibacter palustris]QJR16902.1 Divalent-cation tolerance protein CutA [Usitatibacter palustris]